MVKAWEKLQAAFKMNTTVGKSTLELGIGHYSGDDGDRYDEIGQGCYFTVDNVTQFTPASEKFRVHLEEKSWTVFGSSLEWALKLIESPGYAALSLLLRNMPRNHRLSGSSSIHRHGPGVWTTRPFTGPAPCTVGPP